MTQSRINALLLTSILVVAVCPMIGSLYFVNRTLSTSLSLGFNSDIDEILATDADNLRSLGRLDPERREQYRKQFERVESLRTVYSSGPFIRDSLHRSLVTYFAIGLLATSLASIAVALGVSRKIARSHSQALSALAAQRERVRYLEELSTWQELAKLLAHEIKNPLTPIEVLATGLRDAHRDLPLEEFGAHLVRTETMILEELGHLKAVVDRFSGFAQLPTIEPQPLDVRALLEQQLHAIGLMFPTARITMTDATNRLPLRAAIDATLFRQALVNIVRNGVEANRDVVVGFNVSVTMSDRSLHLRIANDGVAPPPSLAHRMFEPYVSGKAGKKNLGIGLAITRKIFLEHGGDVMYEEEAGYPAFIVTLPRIVQ